MKNSEEQGVLFTKKKDAFTFADMMRELKEGLKEKISQFKSRKKIAIAVEPGSEEHQKLSQGEIKNGTTTGDDDGIIPAKGVLKELSEEDKKVLRFRKFENWLLGL